MGSAGYLSNVMETTEEAGVKSTHRITKCIVCIVQGPLTILERENKRKIIYILVSMHFS